MNENFALIEIALKDAKKSLIQLEMKWLNIAISSKDPLFTETANGLEQISSAQVNLIFLERTLIAIKNLVEIEGDSI